MVADGKKRVQITFSEAVLDRLDAFCEETGMTRSTYISYIVATSLDQYRNLSQVAEEAIRKAAEE